MDNVDVNNRNDSTSVIYMMFLLNLLLENFKLYGLSASLDLYTSSAMHNNLQSPPLGDGISSNNNKHDVCQLKSLMCYPSRA